MAKTNHRIQALGLTLMSMCLATGLHAADYHVSLIGSDANPGTQNRPLRTIARALAMADRPGDTIQVHEGTYREAWPLEFQASGIPESPITLKAFGSARPVLDGTGHVFKASTALVNIENVDHVRVAGFELANLMHTSPEESKYATRGFRVADSTHVEIVNNKIHDIRCRMKWDGGSNYWLGRANAIGVYGESASRTTTDILIDGNEVYDCDLGWSEAITVNGNVDGFTVSNNRVHDVDNIGIDCIGHEGDTDEFQDEKSELDRARNGRVFGNRISNVSGEGNLAYQAKPRHSTAEGPYDLSVPGIYVDGGMDIIVERNTVQAADYGISLASEHEDKTTDRVVVRNNIVYGCRRSGIVLGGSKASNGGTRACYVLNNTFYRNNTSATTDGQIMLQKHLSKNAFINNIVTSSHSDRRGEYVFITHNEPEDALDNMMMSRNLYYSKGGDALSVWQWRGAHYRGFQNFRNHTRNTYGYLKGSGSTCLPNDDNPYVTVSTLFLNPATLDFIPWTGPYSFTDGKGTLDPWCVHFPFGPEGNSMLGDYDFYGKPRITDGSIDIGAVEAP